MLCCWQKADHYSYKAFPAVITLVFSHSFALRVSGFASECVSFFLYFSLSYPCLPVQGHILNSTLAFSQSPFVCPCKEAGWGLSPGKSRSGKVFQRLEMSTWKNTVGGGGDTRTSTPSVAEPLLQPIMYIYVNYLVKGRSLREERIFTYFHRCFYFIYLL